MNKVKQAFRQSTRSLTTAAGNSHAEITNAAKSKGSQPPVLNFAHAPAKAEAPVQRTPYKEEIARAFGRHDISNVKAHTGNSADESSGSLGTHAYTTGNNVSFKSSPDLHTAAHEAVHVVQDDRNKRK